MHKSCGPPMCGTRLSSYSRTSPQEKHQVRAGVTWNTSNRSSSPYRLQNRIILRNSFERFHCERAAYRGDNTLSTGIPTKPETARMWTRVKPAAHRFLKRTVCFPKERNMIQGLDPFQIHRKHRGGQGSMRVRPLARFSRLRVVPLTSDRTDVW